MKKLQYKYLKTSDLIPYARNARKHSEKQVNQIAGSIREFGFINPVIVDKDNGIVAGHGRVLAAQKLALNEVPCILVDYLTEAQKRAYILADNKLALNSTWDEGLLADELKALKEMEFDFDIIGFDDFNFQNDEFMPDLPEENEDNSVPEEKLTLIVTLQNQDEKQMLFDELNSRGYKVK